MVIWSGTHGRSRWPAHTGNANATLADFGVSGCPRSQQKNMRSIPEWIGKTDDTAPPPRVKLRIFENHGGCCNGCKRKLYPGDLVEFDHIKPLWDGGENRESNIQPMCLGCHKPKTAAEARQRGKGRRLRMKQAGIKRRTQKIPYRRFDGTAVWPKG